jgi:hypothetical protein
MRTLALSLFLLVRDPGLAQTFRSSGLGGVAAHADPPSAPVLTGSVSHLPSAFRKSLNR